MPSSYMKPVLTYAHSKTAPHFHMLYICYVYALCLSLHCLMMLILVLQDGLFMIAFDKPWAAVEWAVTLQMAMLRYALLPASCHSMAVLIALCKDCRRTLPHLLWEQSEQ